MFFFFLLKCAIFFMNNHPQVVGVMIAGIPLQTPRGSGLPDKYLTSKFKAFENEVANATTEKEKDFQTPFFFLLKSIIRSLLMNTTYSPVRCYTFFSIPPLPSFRHRSTGNRRGGCATTASFPGSRSTSSSSTSSAPESSQKAPPSRSPTAPRATTWA
jgi:hypothetical protein